MQAYLDRVAEYRDRHPEQREGQAHANVWLGQFPGYPFPTACGPVDPFFDDAKLPVFLAFVREVLDGEEPW
jgi:hypothetical protein